MRVICEPPRSPQPNEPVRIISSRCPYEAVECNLSDTYQVPHYLTSLFVRIRFVNGCIILKWLQFQQQHQGAKKNTATLRNRRSRSRGSHAKIDFLDQMLWALLSFVPSLRMSVSKLICLASIIHHHLDNHTKKLLTIESGCREQRNHQKHSLVRISSARHHRI